MLNKYLRHPAAFIVILFIIFLPTFITVYGAHTDGFLMLTKPWDLLGHPEAQSIYILGRPLGAFIISMAGWLVHDVHDFIVIRVMLFLMMLFLYQRLIALHIRVYRMDESWARLMAFLIVLLPINVVNIVWLSNGIPEYLSVLLSVFSYEALEERQGSLPPAKLIKPASLFMLAILIYPPMAMIVFAFICIRMLWLTQDLTWPQARFRLVAQSFFYCALIGCYWLLVKFLVVPLGTQVFKFLPQDGLYQMDISNTIATKIKPFCDTFRHSLLGTFDFWWNLNRGYEWQIIRTVGVLILGLGLWTVISRCFIRKEVRVDQQSVIIFGEKCIALLGFYLLANIPFLMAVNCRKVVGYRVLLAPSMIAVALILRWFKFYQDVYQSLWARRLIKAGMVLFTTGIVMAAGWVVKEAVRNYSIEYRYLDERARAIDYNKASTILLGVNREGETLIDHLMPFELGLMTTVAEHAQYIFEYYSKRAHRAIKLVDLQLGWVAYQDEYTALVDMTQIRGKEDVAFPAHEVVGLRALAIDGKQILIEPENRMADPQLLMFKERKGQGSSWEIGPSIASGGMLLDYGDSPQAIVAYKMDATSRDGANQSVDYGWLLQASSDGLGWVNLSSQSWAAAQGEVKSKKGVFGLSIAAPFRFYRLQMIKRDPSDIMTLRGVQFFKMDNFAMPKSEAH